MLLAALIIGCRGPMETAKEVSRVNLGGGIDVVIFEVSSDKAPVRTHLVAAPKDAEADWQDAFYIVNRHTWKDLTFAPTGPERLTLYMPKESVAMEFKADKNARVGDMTLVINYEYN